MFGEHFRLVDPQTTVPPKMHVSVPATVDSLYIFRFSAASSHLSGGGWAHVRMLATGPAGEMVRAKPRLSRAAIFDGLGVGTQSQTQFPLLPGGRTWDIAVELQIDGDDPDAEWNLYGWSLVVERASR